MSIRQETQIKGSVHDVARLSALSGDDCHVLFVSSRTLYLLANYATLDVDFLGRYAKGFLDGGVIDVVDSGDAEEVLVRQVANNFGLEVIPVCDDLIPAIEQISVQLGLLNGSIQTVVELGGCCSPYGTEVPDDAPILENPDTGSPPADWMTWAAYDTYRCRAANKIADDWIATLTSMATLSGAVATISGIALGLFLNTSLLGGMLVGLIALGFSAGAAAAIIIAALIVMIASGAGLLAYFADLGQEISDDKEELVCQLYNSQSPESAASKLVAFSVSKAALITYDPGDDDALFQAQLSNIVNALFNSAITNTLFELDSETDTYVGTIDCDDCDPSVFILFQEGLNGSPRGTGDLTADGSQRVLSSVEDSDGFHKVAFGVYAESSTLSYSVNCTALPPGVQGTDDENFTVQVNASGGAIDSSQGTQCLDGVHTELWSPSFPTFDTDQLITWMEAIDATDPFTITVTISE